MKSIAFVGSALDDLREFSPGARQDAGQQVQTFASVWDALADTPEEAAHMQMRSDLAMAVKAAVEGWRLTQEGAARRLGITQPRLSGLLRGRIDRFSLDALVGLAQKSGLAVRMEIVEAVA